MLAVQRRFWNLAATGRTKTPDIPLLQIWRRFASPCSGDSLEPALGAGARRTPRSSETANTGDGLKSSFGVWDRQVFRCRSFDEKECINGSLEPTIGMSCGTKGPNVSATLLPSSSWKIGGLQFGLALEASGWASSGEQPCWNQHAQTQSEKGSKRPASAICSTVSGLSGCHNKGNDKAFRSLENR